MFAKYSYITESFGTNIADISSANEEFAFRSFLPGSKFSLSSSVGLPFTAANISFV